MGSSGPTAMLWMLLEEEKDMERMEPRLLVFAARAVSVTTSQAERKVVSPGIRT